MECFGARNTVGFSSQIQHGKLPNQNHITYEGIFNQLKFDVGKKTNLIKDLHIGYARYQYSNSCFDTQINDYLALFVKGNKDGQERDDRAFNCLICLDISGSMDGGLQNSRYNNKEESRLSLSIQAIKMLISKLRPNDSIGLITFNDKAHVIFKPILKSEISPNIYKDLDKIKTDGGTTIKSGFIKSKQLLKNYIQKNKCKNCQNRIILLTDICDNSIYDEMDFLDKASIEDNINLTIIGISDEFRSQVCQKLVNVKGFNYFCALKTDDIKKYVFQTFDFGFFPSAYDIRITIQSQNIKKFTVYGAPDAKLVSTYNNHFVGHQKQFTISRLKSTFPSQLWIQADKTYTFGGLILVKLQKKQLTDYFKGEIKLKYADPFGKTYEQIYNLNFQFHPTEQYFSQQSLRQALEGYSFASEMKQILKNAKSLSLAQIYTKYWPSLSNLQEIIPKCKIEDLKSVKKIVQSYNQNLVKNTEVNNFQNEKFY